MKVCLPLLMMAQLSAAVYDARTYGAAGDGKTVDTKSIQAAIDDAAKSKGEVVFRPGVYLTGAIFVKSGVHLRVDAGVELLGVHDLTAYPVMQTRVAGIEMKWPAALVNVYEQSDVRISGKGVVDGDGSIFWDKYWKMRREYEPKGLRWAVDYDCQRPRLIQVYKSTGVTLEGLTLKRAGFWTVHICYSQRVTADGLVIRNNIGGRGPSTDGVDVDSSSDVLVTRCDIECNDDAICLKAGRDADGLRVNRPTEKVRIVDNTVRAGAAGVTIGSETSGGIRDIEVDGLRAFNPVPAGILFKSASTRGGTIRNITIRNVQLEGVATPVSVTLNWNPSYSYAKMPDNVKDPADYWRVLTEPVPPEKGLPHFRQVRISGLRATGAQRAFAVSSYAESPLEDFEFRDVEIAAKSAGSIANAANWSFTGLKLTIADGRAVAVKDSKSVTGLKDVTK
jgi:polygalacturonase